MTPAPLAILFAILGAALAALAATSGVLWRRVRALTPPVAPAGASGPDSEVAPPAWARREHARRLDDLDGRHRAIEARLARLEVWAATASASASSVPPGAIASHPAGPRGGRRGDRGGPATAGGPTLIAIPNLGAASASAPAPGAAAGLDRRFGAVWALADAGAPASVVARETGYPVGQVELILGLRRQLAAGEAGPDA